MPITLKIDTGGFSAKIANYEKKAVKEIAKELNIFGFKSVNDAKRMAPVDEGHLVRSISFDPASEAKLKVSVVVAADYAAYVEFGTRTFAAAYVASLPANWQQYAATFKGKGGGSYNDFIFRLKEWVIRKGIATGDDVDNVAYLIAKKILRNGIRPHPFLYPSITKNLIELKKRFNA